ncbi:hypothetical protein [Undibacterium sp. Tian12W]|uniref:hypothetical protein n=1 Tax=Undibacterium sp. Tian12W TaxID=3413054 RepID=UPI003BEFD694
MKERTGDLLALALQGEFDVIVHGCNCFCNMGAGIAKSIKKQFPEAYAADQTTLPADHAKLGSYSQARIQRGDRQFVILNAYTQFDWRGQGGKPTMQQYAMHLPQYVKNLMACASLTH